MNVSQDKDMQKLAKEHISHSERHQTQAGISQKRNKALPFTMRAQLKECARWTALFTSQLEMYVFTHCIPLNLSPPLREGDGMNAWINHNCFRVGVGGRMALPPTP